jgi:hypothetical protein
VTAYVDLNFAASMFKAGPSASGDLTALSGFTFTRASTAWGFGSNGLLQSFASNTARLVYDPVTLASLGILVEEARTNLCLQSQTFDSGTWTKQAAATTVTANATSSPDGTADADLFTENTAFGAKSCYQGITSAAGTYTWSVYFKAGSGSTRYLRLTLTSSASDFGYMTVNMSTGAITQAAAVIGTATAASGDVTSVGGGWYRARLTTMLAASTGICFFIPLDTGTPAVVAGDYGRDSYTGNGSTWSLWQAQLEAGTGASSPIPTTTAAVARAADALDISGLSITYPCTIIAEIGRPYAVGSTTQLLSIDNGSTTDLSSLLFAAAGGFRIQMKTSNTNVADITSAATLTVGTIYNAGVRYAADDVNQVLSGVLGTQDTSCAVPPTSTHFRIGINSSGSSGAAYVRRARVFLSAFPDTKLQSYAS